VCFYDPGPVCEFCDFGELSLVCFELTVPVQVIAWKDFYIMCRAGRKNSTHSLTHSH